MTAFDNIKTNNWPSASNEFEDFLVLELPLNDAASLTESRRDIVAGSKVLFPKRTLTNTGASSLSTEGRVWSDALDAANTNDLPFRSSRTIQDAFGSTSVQVETATNGTGRIIWLDFANNGGALTGSTLKILGAGVTASLRDVYLNNASTKSGQLDDLLNITGVTVNSIQIKSNASNAGAAIAGIELDGVRLVDPISGSKKHYDNNIDFGTTSQDKHLTVPASSNFAFGNGPWCIECWAKLRSAPTNGSAIWDFDTSAGFQGYEDWICGYYQGTNVWFYWGSSNYDGIYASFTAHQWQHWAWTWDGTTARLFRDGTIAVSTTTTNKSAGWGSGTRNLTIGKQVYDSPNRFGDLQVQDFRVYKGTAKYTSNFTPPSAILG